MAIFPVEPIKFEGENSDNALAYHYYDKNKKVLGKSMEDHLRIAVCWWHNFCWNGFDIFGEGTFEHPWLKASDPMKASVLKMDAMFELLQKTDLKYFTFHDRDIAPEGGSLKESNANVRAMADKIAKKMQDTGKELLWGTANLFSNKRYMAGAATNPNPDVFAFAAAQVKNAMDVTYDLGGHNYVFWGGREGYDTLLNTDMKREAQQMARFLSMAVEYKHKIGFKGTLLIEPKPCEPTKHQYDYDTATVYAFLQKFGLEKEFKVNIEGNHATLSGHSYPHEVAYACANDLLGNIDANQGDAQLGWDLDLYPTNTVDNTLVMYYLLKHGGFTTGGFNFDTKLRRQSIDLADFFHGHVGGVDALARGLIAAAELIENDTLQANIDKRYAAWQDSLGQDILNGSADMASMAQYVEQNGTNPAPVSGQQERLERILNETV
tara:strand:+ start:4033 stop:5340 length:1308 start_codon:yes stop_codon:yes gene_type:complete